MLAKGGMNIQISYRVFLYVELKEEEEKLAAIFLCSSSFVLFFLVFRKPKLCLPLKEAQECVIDECLCASD